MLTSALVYLAIAAGAFVVVGALLYVRQDRMLFYPRANDATLREQWKWRRIEIASGDHVLEGWWADAGAPESSTVVLYFGGNGEDVLYTATTAARFEAKRMLFVNYRGYGGTKGKPSQQALYDDALAIYEYAVGAGGTTAEDIVVMGRSLGSGVATMLAAERNVRAAILITPYDSIASVAAHHYPYFPAARLIRHRFPSIDFARRAHVPALILIAERDRVIPPIHAQRLAEAWAGDTEVHVLAAASHNDIDLQPAYDLRVNEFLKRTSASK